MVGTVIVVITLSLGASLTYIIANYFFKDLIKEKFANKFKFLEEKIKSNEFFAIFNLYVVIGGIPFQIQNLLPVLFNVKLKKFFLWLAWFWEYLKFLYFLLWEQV